MGVNLYNPGIQTPLDEMRAMEGGRLTILGVIPPRDVLASGSPNEVAQAVEKLLADTASNPLRLILSCAGGMPPDTSTENLHAFRDAVKLRSPIP